MNPNDITLDLASPLKLKGDTVIKTADHPEADGKTALPGARAFSTFFPVEGGGKLYLHMGLAGFINLAATLLTMLDQNQQLKEDVELAMKRVKVSKPEEKT